MLRIRTSFLLLISFLTLFACSDDQSKTDKQLTKAHQLIAAGYESAALIEINEILTRTPDSIAALRLRIKTEHGPDHWFKVLPPLLQAKQAGVDDPTLLLTLVAALNETGYADKALRLISELDTSLNEVPDKNALRILQAESLTKQGKFNEAIALLVREISNPLLADKYRSALQLSEAEIRLQQLNDQHPFLPAYDNMNLPGSGLWRDQKNQLTAEEVKNLQQIESLLIELSASEDHEAQQLILKSEIALINNNPQIAMTLLDELLAKDKENKVAQTLLVRAHYQSGNYNSAEQYIRKQITLDQTTEQQLNDANILAAILIRKNENEAAEEVLKELYDQGIQDQNSLISLGQIALRQSRFNDLKLRVAKEYLESAVTLAPKSAYAHAQLAMFYIQTQSFNLAEKSLKQSRFLASNDPAFSQALMDVYLKTGQLQNALQIANTLISQFPQITSSYQSRAHVYSQMNEQNKAEKDWKKSLSLDAESVTARISLARLYRHQGRLDEAKSLLDNGLKRSPVDPHLQTERAILDDHRGRFKAAYKRLKSIQLQNPNHWQAELALGYLALRAGQINSALASLKQLQNRFSDLPPVLLFEARVMQAIDNPMAARQVYEKLITQQPGHPASILGLVNTHLTLRQTDLAASRIAQFRRNSPRLSASVVSALILLREQQNQLDQVDEDIKILIKQDRNIAVAYTIYADKLLLNGQNEKAVKFYQRALFKHQDSEVLIKLTNALMEVNRAGDAISLLKTMRQQRPDHVYLSLQLAEVLYRSNDQPAAISELQRLLSEHPDNLFALQKIAEYSKQSSAGNVQDKQAWEYAKQAYMISELSPPVLATYGQLCIEKGRTTEGLDALKRAIQSAPQNVRYQLHLVEGLTKAGKDDLAKELLDAIFQSELESDIKKEAQDLMTNANIES